MRVEIEQLERSREACREHAKELENEMWRVGECHKEACADAERLRENAKWDLFWAKDWRESREKKLRHAHEKLEKLHCDLERLRAEADNLAVALQQAEADLASAQRAAYSSETENGIGCAVDDVSRYEDRCREIGQAIQRNRENRERTEKRIERQHAHIADCGKELEKAVEEEEATARATMEAERKAEEKIREAGEELRRAQEEHEKAMRTLDEVTQAIERAWDALKEYERYND